MKYNAKKAPFRAIMLGGGRVIAAGTVAELEQSDDQDVYNFFHRIAASPAGPASSPLDRMTHARTP